MNTIPSWRGGSAPSNLSPPAPSLTEASFVQAQIKKGEKEFEFYDDGLHVSVVPIHLEGESLVGYVAVASL